MSRASASRRERRAMKSAGVALVDRVALENDAIAAVAGSGASVIDFVAYHVAGALERLDAAGGDVLGHAVVTIGRHPDYPGALTIEAKVANRKPVVELDPGCPIDHSLDGDDAEG